MRYVITSNKRNGYLTGFYDNGGWTIKDVFAFSSMSYYTFESEQETQEFIIGIKERCIKQADRWGDWLDKALIFWKTLNYKQIEGR